MDPSVSKVFQMKVSIKRSKPAIWRRVLVPFDSTFRDLHFAILDIFQWSGTHLHKFELQSKIRCVGKNLQINDYSGFKDSQYIQYYPGSTRLSEYFKFKKPKDKIEYVYNFSSSWYHIVYLEKIISTVQGVKYPCCVAGRRATPPENNPRPYYDAENDESAHFNYKDIVFRDHSQEESEILKKHILRMKQLYGRFPKPEPHQQKPKPQDNQISLASFVVWQDEQIINCRNYRSARDDGEYSEAEEYDYYRASDPDDFLRKLRSRISQMEENDFEGNSSPEQPDTLAVSLPSTICTSSQVKESDSCGN